MTGDEIETSFPLNARLVLVQFDDGRKELQATLDQESVRVIPSTAVEALFGGRIRREAIHVEAGKRQGNPLMKMGMLAAGIPVNPLPKKSKDVEVHTQEMHYVLAMRVAGVAELWYLMGSSFNFRKALGPEAGYALELNVRAFIRRLAAFCPEARQDAFFQALLASQELPPPVDSLLSFLKTASR